MIRRTLAAALLLSAGAAHAQSGQPFFIQETGKSFYRLDDAVKSVNGGDATILVAPGTYKDCATISQGRIAIRAREPGKTIFDGGICEDKATLVLRGDDAMVDGVIFENDRVNDGNGAGIRLEHGNLTVMNATFRDSEEGILTADDPNGVIRVDRSTFSGLGRCDRGLSCAHSLYVGHYGKLFVTRTRFERGMGGHYLKSRAAYNEATDNSFDDSKGRQSNYIIDYPSGTVGRVAGNIMVQGPDKENHSGFIVIAAEERANPSAGLVITGNTATKAPGNSYPMVFVIDYSHEPLKIAENHVGPGIKPFDVR